MFTAWMLANREYSEGLLLTYVEFPSKFVYNAESREWKPRQRGFSVGRLSFDHPSSGFLARKLFVSLSIALFILRFLLTRFVSRLLGVTYLADDILYSRRNELQFPDLTMTEEELRTFCLVELEKLLLNNGKALKDFNGMPFPNSRLVAQYSNSMVLREMQYDFPLLVEEHDSNLPKLNVEQREAYDKIIDCVLNKRRGIFFIYGFSGIGKTFLYKLLSARLCFEKKIVINVASSGIAALLLPGGKTTHSMFGIPTELNEDTVCRISKNSPKADLIRSAKLIIWDEAPMINRLEFEVLDRTFCDIMSPVFDSNRDVPFGGKIMILGGEFRQVLPVIPKASCAEIIIASINSLVLWRHFQIGEGQCGIMENDKNIVEIPSDLIVPIFGDPIADIVNIVYPNIVENYGSQTFFQNKAILAPTVDVVKEINNYIVAMLPGEEKEYLSVDSICGSDAYCDIDIGWITTEFLNQIKCSGLPNHSLKWKNDVPIILLRNIDPAGGLCNGTRLIVRDLGRNVISAEIVSGSIDEDDPALDESGVPPQKTSSAAISAGTEVDKTRVHCVNIKNFVEVLNFHTKSQLYGSYQFVAVDRSMQFDLNMVPEEDSEL
ncbi:uncharacterized protein LOC107484148 [Arachis duranensis]|uniref:ATP-dependent DNA helicase n=1 Tax=Arachis duranensis TaxID=130453 RepID=A0A6P5NHU9_ARADU|nr:uncharacterized protein LOC107484148 [Arachis duranensis]